MAQTICLAKKEPDHTNDIPTELNFLKLFSMNKNKTMAILKDDFYEKLSSKKKILTKNLLF
jgi:hypothetical protein